MSDQIVSAGFIVEEQLERFIQEASWTNINEEAKKKCIDKAGFQINAQSETLWLNDLIG